MIQAVRFVPACRRRLLAAAHLSVGAVVALGLAPHVTAADHNFRRGDVDGNARIEMADAIQTFGYLFLGSPTSLGCWDAADANDSGGVDLSDGVFTLQYLFSGGGPHPSPGPETCGPDTPGDDALTCESSPNCPDDVPTPPAAPTGLTAGASNEHVSLDWVDNAEEDLAGYNVYRSTTTGTGYTKLNVSPLNVSSYEDSAVSNGTRYYYRVAAVNAVSEESPMSLEVSAQPLAPSADSLQDIGHVLDRLAYGPTQAEIERIQQIGLTAYIDEQLHPETIDESSNTALKTREAALFETIVPTKDTKILAEGSMLRYFKGTVEPPSNWRTTGFDDASWTIGASGIGYGDGDDVTILADMEQTAGNPGYMSVYVRMQFQADPAAIGSFYLRVNYDDGFVAYLNGTEVARRGVTGNPPAHTVAATSHDAEGFEDINLTTRKNLLVNGDNLLAIQVHNTALTSSDLSMLPVLVSREVLSGPSIQAIRGITSLQQLLYVRGVYSERQLQAVLAEFWDNHFTTDYDKLVEYLDELENADGSDALTMAQSGREAATLKQRDYQFYYDHALGNFEDLFAYQATSPAMLIYLDNVLNVKGVANENYSREILELFGFGVDNRYTQKDIEQLAKCFTGWNICKVALEELPAFPDSADNPPAVCGVQYTDKTLVNLGAGWKYLKGTVEPTPDGVTPTTAWTEPGFSTVGWLSGSTGIGYGDDDDATILSDMRNNYVSVYLRRDFTVTQEDLDSPDTLLLTMEYDDGFVAYLNGVEVARSENLGSSGNPPPFDRITEEGHEVSDGLETFPLNGYRGLLNVGSNVLAIQMHNTSRDSSDLSCLPKVVLRKILGGVDNGETQAAWTFYFNPAKHDTTAKTLFQGTPYQINVPAGRTGAAGLLDALGPVRTMVTHPSTKEFICIKLIQKFVSDEITIQTKDTAPLPLRSLLADCIAAWGPKGDIRAVMNVIIDAENRQSEFWSASNYRNKVRTPTEFVIASARVLEASISGTGLADVVAAMQWPVFTRDEPDGNEENYLRSTDALKDSIDYVQNLSENKEAMYVWDPLPYLDSRGLDTADEIVGHFSDLLFHGTLSPEDEARLLEFLTTDANYAPKTLLRSNTTDFRTRVQELLGLMLSMPQWQFQ